MSDSCPITSYSMLFGLQAKNPRSMLLFIEKYKPFVVSKIRSYCKGSIGRRLDILKSVKFRTNVNPYVVAAEWLPEFNPDDVFACFWLRLYHVAASNSENKGKDNISIAIDEKINGRKLFRQYICRWVGNAIADFAKQEEMILWRGFSIDKPVDDGNGGKVDWGDKYNHKLSDAADRWIDCQHHGRLKVSDRVSSEILSDEELRSLEKEICKSMPQSVTDEFEDLWGLMNFALVKVLQYPKIRPYFHIVRAMLANPKMTNEQLLKSCGKGRLNCSESIRKIRKKVVEELANVLRIELRKWEKNYEVALFFEDHNHFKLFSEMLFAKLKGVDLWRHIQRQFKQVGR